MTIHRYSDREIAKIRRASRISAAILTLVGRRLEPGVSTATIDRWVREETARRGGRPSQLGYRGFPASVCTSPNEVICHGIPSAAVLLADGDIINIDVTTEVDGFHGDTSETFLIGHVSEEHRHLVASARAARDAGIAAIHPGARLGDIGAAVTAQARAAGLSVVTDFGGHGIGRAMHEPPHVAHVGRAGTGLRLRPGLCITVEPMLNLGRADYTIASDGWTVRTAGGRWSAQFEHTICVTRDGAEILTLAGDGSA